MKISKWILLVSLLGSYAQAQTPPIFEKQRVNIQMYRNTIIKEADDTFRSVKTELCKASVEIDVYDLRLKGGSFAAPYLPCVFEFNNFKYKINMLFASAVDRSDFNGTMPLADVKNYMAWLNPEDWNSSPDLKIPSITTPVSTKDLNTKNMIIHFRPHQMIICMTSDNPITVPYPGPNNAIRVAAKSKDDCQVTNPDAVGAIFEFETLP